MANVLDVAPKAVIKSYPEMIDRCQRLYDFIVEYKRKNDGNSPTYRDVINSVDGLTSSSMVMFYMRKLEIFGLIRWTDPEGTARRVQVVGGHWQMEGE